MPLPESVRGKIFRANEHFDALGAEVLRYFKSKPAELVGQHDTATNGPAVFLRQLLPIPVKIPIIMGDLVGNLRSSLDYLVWELVLAAQQRPTEKNMFPICDTLDRFNVQFRKGRLGGVSAEAAALIESLQPYHVTEGLEKSALFALDKLCNVNKHRHIPLISLGGGAVLGGIPHMIVDGVPFAVLPPDLKTLAAVTVDPREVEVKYDIVAAIAFSDGPAAHMEISSTLKSILGIVRDRILPQFEPFF